MKAVPAAPASLAALDVSDGYATLGAPFVERLDPTPLPEPYLIAFNAAVADLVGLGASEAERPEFVRLAAGCARFGSVRPYAAVYAGHQFGSYAGRLGDGRAITLGEIRTPHGDALEWQLKGAGLTPFSRFGDGRAVLRSTIREYLCSEAMAALDIPTTRALAIAGSDETVFRETPETAAVLTRVAPSHLRFGTFEFFHYGGDAAAVKTVADYAIGRFYPAVAAIAADAERYATFLREIVTRTARLIARWQAVGFAHGVMNTDNMSILGLTLDYGPFGFLDAYEPGFICNHTDAGGRYAFDRQPTIGLWNCHALAAALGTLVAEPDAAAALAAYQPAFRDEYLALLHRKFGLATQHDDDAVLFADAFSAIAAGRVDHTLFFRTLASTAKAPAETTDAVAALFADPAAWHTWLARYRARLGTEPAGDAERARTMRAANPKYVLRNYLAQTAIEAAQRRDYAEIERLQTVLSRPFDEQPAFDRYAAPPPESARAISVSCSS
ncbi:MAG: YdiU family protein [Vulcanimicrobiaceae bacterium]